MAVEFGFAVVLFVGMLGWAVDELFADVLGALVEVVGATVVEGGGPVIDSVKVKQISTFNMPSYHRDLYQAPTRSISNSN